MLTWESNSPYHDRMTLSDPRLGTTLSHYRILERIGGGGMGIALQSTGHSVGPVCRVEVLTRRFGGQHPSARTISARGQGSSALNHPKICTIHDIGEQNGWLNGSGACLATSGGACRRDAQRPPKSLKQTWLTVSSQDGMAISSASERVAGHSSQVALWNSSPSLVRALRYYSSGTMDPGRT